MKRKALSVFLTLCLMFSMCSFALAANEHARIADAVLEKVLERYVTDYSISDAVATVVDKSVELDGSTTYEIHASFKRTLLATDAMEIPAIQGMIAAKNALTDAQEIAAAENYIAARIADLNDNYIGVAQDTSGVYFVTVAPTQAIKERNELPNIGEITVQAPFDNEQAGTLEMIGPRPIAERYQSGQKLIEDVAACAETMNTRSTPHNIEITYYDRVAARNYARDWSCTRGISTQHSSCHNSPKYNFYAGSNGSDCANFVSQCFHEGGLRTDSTWYIDSTAWLTTGNNGNGLRQWIVNNDLFFHTTDVDKAFAGSLVNDLKYVNGQWVNGGHVGIVDQNDFTVQTLCAHSNCRRSYDISNWTYTDSNGVRHTTDYYVPYWDSHFDQWVSE